MFYGIIFINFKTSGVIILKARIIGMGSFLPEKILSNFDLEKMVETTDEWIQSRTGIKERRIAEKEEGSSDLGYRAALKAIEQSNLSVNDIDLIITATISPDYVMPSTAAVIQSKLKAVNAAAMDVSAACTGFIYAISTAKAYIESGMYKNVLVVATEKLSSVVDYEDRNTCVLFGDGASAAVVSGKGVGFLIDAISLGSDGDLVDLLIIPGGGSKLPASKETVAKKLHYLKMDGKEVFKHAVRRMSAAAKSCIEKAGLTEDKIAYLVPHQANIRIIEAIAKGFTLPSEKVYKTLHKYGNTSASSVAIALDEMIREKDIQVGDNILLIAFGAGLTWGSAIIRKVNA